MSSFEDIRPYRDDEVKVVLSKLLQEDELVSMLLKFRFPKSALWQRKLMKAPIRLWLRYKIRNLNSVFDFQCLVERYMQRMIKTTTDGLSSSGLSKLDLSKPHLFISNHRDIALDPAFVNYILHINGQDTLQIAIGDNLLSKTWIADIMRLNRCFIVKRGADSKREKLANSKQLSAYIANTLGEQGDSVWIAQREGRAKDGIDRTNSALISMLGINRDRESDFSSYIHSLNIVPVSISYEFDPCDVAKAQEMVALRETGSYAKEQDEDIHSIKTGIVGRKGKVHLHFGEVLRGSYDNAKQVAEAIDEQVIHNYRLMDSNWLALSHLDTQAKSEQPELSREKLSESYFKSICQDLPNSVRDQLLQMYANPILQSQRQSGTSL
ncbi:cytochrome C oxidase Cbb3 [Alginatibacterium sediminis]|uniref:Cytochrome C oxidase Cbb3 n=2 Tax=Alginatibacterium sediminis TaxID=2164068 RepID=A0A420ENP1_9ALTE|nr:cytochrome C oxidase Cbb3 [Alginatibacterium sediminis]